jgi:TPR repeat protein
MDFSGTSSTDALAKMVLESARDGDAEAQCRVGEWYLLGLEGFSKDDKEAIYWLRKAADQEEPDAQFCLGQCYNDGSGVRLDREEAYKWFARAAENGSCEAQQMLGLSPFASNIESYKWLTLSSESENEHTRSQAQTHLQGLLEHMPENELRLADQEVTNWKAKRKYSNRHALGQKGGMEIQQSVRDQAETLLWWFGFMIVLR